MKTFTKSFVALLAMSSVAVASDLPSRSSPKAPTVPVVTHSTPFFVGVSGGSTALVGDEWSKINNIGVRGGYQFNQFFRAEVAYDYNHEAVTAAGEKSASHLVATNGIVQYNIGSFTPYALVGVGYRINDVKNEAVYNVGGGVRYNLLKNFDVDVRYRYVADFDRVREDNILTAGVEYKF
jgi:opacity protein-like surface antigen